MEILEKVIRNPTDSLISGNGSDDEDLECLRLAALKSIKRPANPTKPPPEAVPKQNKVQRPTFGPAHLTRHHGRGFRNSANRSARNGIFPRARTNTNLISIQTVDSENEHTAITKDVKDEPPKLVLPQDRYHKRANVTETESSRETNKFDRYDNSDNSDSDSDDSNKRNERDSSLERLMKELKETINEEDNEDSSKQKGADTDLCDKTDKTDNDIDDVLILECGETELANEEVLVEDDKVDDTEPIVKEKSVEKQSPKRSSPHRKRTRSRSRSRSRPRYSPHNWSRNSRSPPRKVPAYRPVSPLIIPDPEVITAPLSPRSAAFVLQNREILARRKMSPNSPRRSPSPRRTFRPEPRRRSRSPRFDYPQKRSLSPRGHSPGSPSVRRRSVSPKTRTFRRSPLRTASPFRRSRSPNQRHPPHRRPGTHKKLSPLPEKKPDSPNRRPPDRRSASLSLSPSPERTYHRQPLNGKPHQKEPSPKSNEPLDPVLEARRRKFEKPIIPEPGRKIKLKPEKSIEAKPENEPETKKEEDDEDAIEPVDFDEEPDDSLELNPPLDDLWSDEESDNDNEGRFKSSTEKDKQHITYIPFRKLTEKPRTPLSTLELPRRHDGKKTSRSRSHKDGKHRRDKPSKDKSSGSSSSIKLVEVRSKIKIIPEEDVKKIDKPAEEVRRVKVHKIEDDEKSSTKPSDEVKTKNEEADKETVSVEDDTNDDGGDLRAELSRRRARKMAEIMPTRLLKSALKEVGVKHSSKRSKSDKDKDSGPVKLPIHMRLGINGLANEDIPVRRTKKSRPNRRKRLVQV